MKTTYINFGPTPEQIQKRREKRHNAKIACFLSGMSAAMSLTFAALLQSGMRTPAECWPIIVLLLIFTIISAMKGGLLR